MNFADAKLNTLLKTLSEEEWKEARWFLEGPFHKNRQALLRCFDMLHQFFSHEETPDKQAVFSAAFPFREQFDDLSLRRLMSEVTHCMEEFLTWRQLRQDKNVRSQLLLKALRQRNTGDLFFKTIKPCLTQFEESPPAGAAEDFSAFAGLLHEQYFHPATNLRSTSEGQALVQALQNLELAFLVRSLCYRVELEERRRLLGEPLPDNCLSLQPETLKTYRSFAPKFPVVDLLLKLLDMFAAEDKLAAFHLANDAFHVCKDQLGDFEWALMLNVLTNAAIVFSNNGGVEEYRNLWSLYHSKLKRQQQTEPGAPMSAETFLNVYFTACLAQEFDWTTAFQITWAQCLPEHDRKPTLILCEAFRLFQQGRFSPKNRHLHFDKARRLLAGFSCTGKVFQLRLRPLELLLFYESPQEIPEQTLFAHVKSYERFLSNGSNVSKSWGKRFLTFLTYLNQMVKLRSAFHPNGMRKSSLQKKGINTYRPSVNKILELEKALGLEQNIAFKDWLLEKVQELK